MSEFKTSKKQTGMQSESNAPRWRVRRVAPWRGLVWDPFVKVNVCGCVIVRSRLFNGGCLFFLFSIVPFVAQPSPTNDTLESTTKICAVEESQGRKTCHVTVARITNPVASTVGVVLVRVKVWSGGE